MGREQGFSKVIVVIIVAGVATLAVLERKTLLSAWTRFQMAPTERGLSDMRRMRFDLAQKAFEEAVHQNPADAQALYSLGWALQAQGRDNEALAQYAKAAAAGKDQAELIEKIYVNSGAIYFKQRNLDDAAESYRQALSVNPNQMDSRFQYGMILSEKGLDKEALEQFQMIVKLTPSHAAAAAQMERIKSSLSTKPKTVKRKAASVAKSKKLPAKKSKTKKKSPSGKKS